MSLIGACFLALAPAAHAGDISVDDSLKSFTYKADNGETNNVQFTQSGETVTVADAGAPIDLSSAAGRCAATDANNVTCTVPLDYSLKVSLVDQDDYVAVTAASDIKLEGGTGSDTLLSGSGNDNLIGDTPSSVGNDVLDGGAGTDKFTAGDGADRLYSRDGYAEEPICGTGVDHIVADTFDLLTTDCETTEIAYVPAPVGPDPEPAPTGTDGRPDPGPGTDRGPLGNGDPSAALPAPDLGVSMNVSAGLGTVNVKLPGTGEWVPLSGGAEIPVGSVIDATRGPVTLTSAVDADGNVQDGTFWGGAFAVTQKPGSPMVTLALRGGDFSVCQAQASRTTATAARGRHTIRSLWSRDRGGRFRSRGRNSHATIRGTEWLTADRCDGTLTRVREGKVAVRDYGRKRTVQVSAGERYLARKR